VKPHDASFTGRFIGEVAPVVERVDRFVDLR
jgi:hypothetical protein